MPTSVEWYKGATKITFDNVKKLENNNNKQLASGEINYFSNITIKVRRSTGTQPYCCSTVTHSISNRSGYLTKQASVILIG